MLSLPARNASTEPSSVPYVERIPSISRQSGTIDQARLADACRHVSTVKDKFLSWDAALRQSIEVFDRGRTLFLSRTSVVDREYISIVVSAILLLPKRLWIYIPDRPHSFVTRIVFSPCQKLQSSSSSSPDSVSELGDGIVMLPQHIKIFAGLI
jgi:hypothetical protein